MKTLIVYLGDYILHIVNSAATAVGFTLHLTVLRVVVLQQGEIYALTYWWMVVLTLRVWLKKGWQFILPKYINVERLILFLSLNKSRFLISIHTCMCFFTYVIDKNQAFVCFKQNIFIRSDTLLPLFLGKNEKWHFSCRFYYYEMCSRVFFLSKETHAEY